MKMLLAILSIGIAFSASDADAQTAPIKHVTNCLSNGDGSLPQLVRDSPSGTTIVFDFECSGSANQIIELDSAMIVSNKSITVNAGTYTVNIMPCLALTCASRFTRRRLFTVDPGSTLTLIHLHMMNGSGGQDSRSTPVRKINAYGGFNTHGGAIHVKLGGTLYLDASQIVDSDAIEGGAIFNEGTAVISNTDFERNTAQLGGAISNSGNLTLTGSNIANMMYSSDGEAGGLMNYGTATVINSTIAYNRVPRGAGILNEGTLTLINATITGNTTGPNAPPTSGNGLLTVAGTVTISNSILSGNGDFPRSPNCVGTVIDGGNNLSFNDTSCGFALNAVSADPQLDTLAWVGGPVRILALRSNSPAIGAGNNAICKHASGYCDIGAYDSKQPKAVAPVSAPPPPPPPDVTVAPAEVTREKMAPGTFRITTPSGTARGEATFVCAVMDGRTKITIVMGSAGLMGGLAATVIKRGARTYEIGEDEERGFTAGFSRLQPPMASYPATTGTVTILEWTEARVRGTFTYSGEVEDANGVAQKHTVSGSFNAKPTFPCS